MWLQNTLVWPVRAVDDVERVGGFATCMTGIACCADVWPANDYVFVLCADVRLVI